MTTLAGSILTFIQYAWTLASPGTAGICWSGEWWNSRYPTLPQISVSNLASPKIHANSTGGSMNFKYKPIYVANVWQQIPRGSSGTQEMANVEAMRLEVCKVFRTQFSGTALANANYAGSLNPFCVVFPMDNGVPRHELTETPRMLRYEITLMSVRDNE